MQTALRVTSKCSYMCSISIRFAPLQLLVSLGMGRNYVFFNVIRFSVLLGKPCLNHKRL